MLQLVPPPSHPGPRPQPALPLPLSFERQQAWAAQVQNHQVLTHTQMPPSWLDCVCACMRPCSELRTRHLHAPSPPPHPNECSWCYCLCYVLVHPHLLSFSCANVADDAPPRSTASRRRLSMATAGAGAGAGQPAAAPANGGVTGGMLCCVGGPYVGVVLVLRCNALWWLQCMVGRFDARLLCLCCALLLLSRHKATTTVSDRRWSSGRWSTGHHSDTSIVQVLCVCCVVAASKVPEGSQLTHGACLLLAAKHQAWSVDSCEHTRQPKGACPLDGCVVVVVRCTKRQTLTVAARCLCCTLVQVPGLPVVYAAYSRPGNDPMKREKENQVCPCCRGCGKARATPLTTRVNHVLCLGQAGFYEHH